MSTVGSFTLEQYERMVEPAPSTVGCVNVSNLFTARFEK